MKKISVVVPCYNEEHSIRAVCQRVERVFAEHLPSYEYEIIYVDDCSKDGSRALIRQICRENPRCRAVLNAKNFGFHRNVFSSFFYASGDAVFMMFGDLQDPPELLPQFVAKWEQGYKCIVGQRAQSDEKGIMRLLRRLYYKTIDMLAQSKQIQNMDGYGLYDRQFVEILRQIDEVEPYFKAVIDEYGLDLCVIPYHQNNGMREKSNFNFWRNYDFAMHGITASTKFLMRIVTFLGAGIGGLSLIYAAYVVIRKLLFWDSYPFGIAQVMVAVLFLGSAQLFFIGVLGEYILSINDRSVKKPRVVVEEKVNFGEEQGDGRSA